MIYQKNQSYNSARSLPKQETETQSACKRVQQQHANRGQPCGRNMIEQLSHGQILPCGKSGTVTTGDVLESEEMVAPPHNVLALHHSSLHQGEGRAIKGDL